MLQDSATPKMVRNVIDGTTPPQKVEGQYVSLENGKYNLTVGVTGAAPAQGSVISQINGNKINAAEAETAKNAETAENSPKSLYNLGAFDTYVDNGDGTVTVTRNRDGATYTETLPADVPLNTLDQHMSDIVRDEVEKTLNLANPWSTGGGFAGVYYTISENGAFLGTANEDTRPWNYSHANIYMVLQPGTYTASVTFSGTLARDRGCMIFTEAGTELCNLFPPTQYEQSFTLSQETSIGIEVKCFDGGIAEFMLNEGDHAYPYQPYNGAIVHEIRTPLYFSTDNVSPASIDQIGGNWTSLGSFMVGSNTIYAWKKA